MGRQHVGIGSTSRAILRIEGLCWKHGFGSVGMRYVRTRELSRMRTALVAGVYVSGIRKIGVSEQTILAEFFRVHDGIQKYIAYTPAEHHHEFDNRPT